MKDTRVTVTFTEKQMLSVDYLHDNELIYEKG